MIIAGARIRRLRTDSGRTLAAVAEDAAISPSYLSMIERGQRRCVSEPVIRRLARALDVDRHRLQPGLRLRPVR